MRETGVPSDMLLQRNENLTYTLVDSINLEDVENIIDRRDLIKVINAAYNSLLIARATEAKQAEEEEREPDNIMLATLTTKSGGIPNTIDTLFTCKIDDIMPNNFYKFLDKYRSNLADNGVTFELVESSVEDDKIRIVYTDNTSSTVLPVRTAKVEEVPEKELEKSKKQKKTKKKEAETSKLITVTEDISKDNECDFKIKERK